MEDTKEARGGGSGYLDLDLEIIIGVHWGDTSFQLSNKMRMFIVQGKIVIHELEKTKGLMNGDAIQSCN